MVRRRPSFDRSTRALARAGALAAAVAFAAFAALGAPSVARADDIDAAADATLTTAGCDDAKLSALRKEFEAKKTASLLRDMGACYEAMGQLGAAISSYDSYLRTAKDATDKGAITAKIEELKKKKEEAAASAGKGFLDVKVNVSGAEVKIDGETKGKSPLPTKLSLTAGLYEVGVTASGYPEWLGTANVTEGETTLLNVELEKKGGVPVLAIVGVIAGVVLVGVAVGIVVGTANKLPEPSLGTITF